MSAFNILIVEDHATWQDILQESVKRALDGIGCTCDLKVLKTFEEALTALNKQGPWHLLIVDIGLRPSQAEKLGMRLAERSHHLQVPCIVVSGMSKLTPWNVRNLLKKYKARDFFSKPDFDDEEFVKKVQKVLQKTTSPQDETSTSTESMPTSLQLRTCIIKHFDLEEFRTLCSDLGVDYDSLRGEGKEGKVRELIARFQRREDQEHLVAIIRHERGSII